MNEMRPSPERSKLLKFINVFAIGGTERQFVLTTEGIDPSRFEVHLACLQRSGQLLERIERLGYPLVHYPTRSLYAPATFREQLRFARYLREKRIGIVHTYNFYPNVFGVPAARLAGVKRIIASVRDIGAYLTPLQVRAQAVACRMADAIVANAEAVRTWLIANGHPPEKISVIHNGVDLTGFSGAVATGKLHDCLGLPRQTRLVGVLARVSPLKGLDDFVVAASEIARRFPEVRFVILGGHFQSANGDGDPETRYRRELESLGAQLGVADRIHFAGYRTDIADVLPELELTVLPSLSEGFPNAVLESMAAGVPVVATRVGGVPEAIDDGCTGWLVPMRDPKAIASAVCRALDNPEYAATVAAAARRSVTERFSVERMIQKTEELYLHVAKPEVKSHALC